MMEFLGGFVLVVELLVEVVDFCRVMCDLEVQFKGDWWFKVWGLDYIVEEGMLEWEDWIICVDDNWYGFGKFVFGFNMFDFIKVIVIILGLMFEGDFDEFGIFVGVLIKYFVEYGIIVEKIGFYFFFIMFIIGIIKGCWNMLFIELQ